MIGAGRTTASGGRQSAGAAAAVTMSGAATIETGVTAGTVRGRGTWSAAAGRSATSETATGDYMVIVKWGWCWA